MSFKIVYRIEVQAGINVQVGEFLKNDKRAKRNEHTSDTNCKKSSNVQYVMIK